MFRDTLRKLNSLVFNKVILRVAGKPLVPLAVMHHVGRKSGKPYSTPVLTRRVRGGFMFALMYGANVDWYRNVSAAGKCELQWHGRTYHLHDPHLLEADEARQTFPLFLQLFMRVVKTKNFVRMSIVKARA